MNSANDNTKPNEAFNINDDESQRRHLDNKDETPSGRKSPALSIVSTASSGSPLIRSGSTASKADSGAGGSPKRPAPTSIAAAQLQQQQLQHGQTPLKKQSAKVQNGNKLAHMAKMAAISSQATQFEQQVADLDHRLKGSTSKPQVQRDKPKRKFDEDQAKSFGYKFGKSLAFRANRFNQFWSVNKMRYMNLACLLMTLVCLCTILLFSKSKLGYTRSELSPAQHQRAGVASPLVSAGAGRHKNRIGSALDQEADQEAQQGNAIEFTVRQQFAHKAASDKDDQSEPEWASGSDADEQIATSRPVHSDGFNLFDERHDQNQAQDQDQDLIQEARKQLKRQQETELEMEDENGSSNGGSRPSVLVSVQRSRPLTFLQDPINQVLQDLDGFGLFKSMRLRLAEQLKQQNLTSKAPTVIRGKNGATIIMSFTQQNADSNNTATNETAPSASSLVESMPSLLRDLLPPGVLEQSRRSPSGFAAIALDTQPRATLSLRSSNLPFGGAIFESSSSPFELPPLFMPPPPPPFQLFGQQRSALTQMQPNGGLMSMLFRASRELAHQMRHQMEQMAANSATNQTSIGSTNDTKQEKQAQTSQQQVKVIQLNGGATDQNNDKLQQSNSTESDAAAATDEVETFSTASFVRLPPRQQQLGASGLAASPATIFSTGRSAAAPRSMLMIESSSGVPSSLLGADGDQVQPPPMLAPFPLMPSVFFMGQPGSGQSSSEWRNRVQSGPNPLLRSLIGSVVSDLTRSMASDNEKTSSGRPTISRSDESSSENRDQDGSNGDNNEWDEWTSESSEEPSGGATGPNHEDPFVRSAVSGSAGSLFEHMLDHLTSNRHRPQVASPSGATFKHTLRTPSGITIERIAGLPAGVQTVAPNVRSQSLSLMDSPPLPMESDMGNRLPRNRVNLSQDEQQADSGASWRQLADEHHNQHGDSTRRAMRSRQSATDRMDSPQPPEYDQHDNFPTRIRVASARIRLLSGPRLDSAGPPLHFRLPAQPEQATSEESSTAFTSPSWPLFGFPALKQPESTSSGSEQENSERNDSTRQTSGNGQRRQRSFVYHSNHELAKAASPVGRRVAPQVVSSQHKQLEPVDLARSAAASQQRQLTAPLPPAAAVVMGRRLDDLVER